MAITDKFKKFFYENEKWIFFIVSLLLHLWKIGADLPSVYNPDEPHNFNVAGYLASGHFAPYDFKYPMLWIYVIVFALGFLFLGAKFLGLVSSPHAFSIWYLANPTPFYLCVRVVSAVLVSLAPVALYQGGLSSGRRSYARALALFCLLTPFSLYYGRDANVYGILIFTMAIYFQQLHTLYYSGSPRSYLLSGATLGLVVSTHFLAAPLALLLPGLHFAKGKMMKDFRLVLMGSGAALLVFIALNPFLILGLPAFLETVRSYNAIQHRSPVPLNIAQVLKNGWKFLDTRGIGCLIGIVGFVLTSKTYKKVILALLVPFLICLPYQATALYGGYIRYSLPINMPFIMIAALGLIAILDRISNRRNLRKLLLVLIFVPLIFTGISESLPSSFADTRTLAKKWIEQNIPSGSKFLIFDPFEIPPLRMSKIQLARLYAQCVASNNPRKEYYGRLLEVDSGMSYELFLIKRMETEHQDVPVRVQKSYEAQDIIDPETTGLADIKKHKIDYLIVDINLLAGRKDSPWLLTLLNHRQPIYEIVPRAGQLKGPPIKIYKISD